MDRLFAPWRLEVIEKYKEASSCILCGLLEEKDESKALILHRGKKAYVVLNKYPYQNGHLMIVPDRHIGDFCDLEPDETGELTELSQRAMRVMKKELNCAGFNWGANFGSVAGAGIPDHVHLHLVPRWAGDHNFMPVLAETKVISEHLERTYEKLKLAWEKDKS